MVYDRTLEPYVDPSVFTQGRRLILPIVKPKQSFLVLLLFTTVPILIILTFYHVDGAFCKTTKDLFNLYLS